VGEILCQATSDGRRPVSTAGEAVVNDFDLTGRRVLVTGGGDGLGRQFVTALVEAGAEAVICGRREAPLEETRDALTAAGGRVEVVVADVTDDDDRVRLASAAGDIDVLVNNAGVSSRARWDTVVLDDWRYIMNLNVEAPFRLVQLLAPGMVERGFGRIVNIASIYGLVAGDPSRYPGHGLDIGSYFASKHALIGLTKSLAVDLGGTGVTVNALCPGMFPSPANDEVLTPAVAAALEGGTPVGRLGTDRDLRTAILYLAAPGSGFVTGQSVVVDGGWTIW
jgi:gluconate 5-dehydrogenase